MNEDYLIHRGHKYISKEKVNGKWRYYYHPNKYEINSKNYKTKMAVLSRNKEWNDIVARNDPEYTYVDDNGQTQYNLDKYLLNKKHPVLDALSDYSNGRQVTTLKQDKDTVWAGAKDYAEMGRRTVENVLTGSVGILSLKILNQQGSLDDEKAKLSSNIKAAKSLVKDVLKTYKEASSSASTTASNLTKNATSSGITDEDIDKIAKTAKRYRAMYS